MNLTSSVFLLLTAILLAPLVSSGTMAQSVPPSVEQQDAVELMKTLARDLKREPDKLAVGRLQARIADELWTFDERFSRDAFRWSFDAVSQSPAADLAREKQSSYVNRQAAAVKEVLRLLGKHDSKLATAWLKNFESEGVAKNPTAKTDSSRPDLLMQIAAQLAMTDPDQAAKLGQTALSGNRVPEGFGTLLFGLRRNSRSLADELFRAAVATLRRSNYVYDPALIVVANYLFSSDGRLHSDASPADAQLLANFYVDAAWQQPGGDGKPVPPASASFYNTLEIRALPIVASYAPDRLPELRGQMARLAAGLSAEQIQRGELLRSTQHQEASLANRNNGTIDEQIERAEKEKNVEVRDAMFNSIAHGLMRIDADQALKVAKKIDDAKLRMLTEDDVYLIQMQQLLRSPSVAEARKLASLFNNPLFRAKIMIQVAAKVWSSNKDQAQAAEILSEALAVAMKSDDVPDKALALLQVVEQFAKFDSIRAFEVLGTALATMNRIKPEKDQTASTSTKPPLLRIKSITVINGIEMTTTNDATLDSIDFREVRALVSQDYMQTRLLANKLEQPVQRANYLTAVATSVLKSDKVSLKN